MKRKLTPHQRIIRAANAGKGLRLTADEVWHLSCDGAIETRAGLDDMPDGEEAYERERAMLGAIPSLAERAQGVGNE